MSLDDPLQVLLQWDDEGNDRQLALELFDAFGSKGRRCTFCADTGRPTPAFLPERATISRAFCAGRGLVSADEQATLRAEITHLRPVIAALHHRLADQDGELAAVRRLNRDLVRENNQVQHELAKTTDAGPR